MQTTTNHPNQTLLQTSFPKDKIKILLLENIDQSAVEIFEKAGYSNIESLSRALPEDELAEKIQDVRLLGIRSKTQITEKVITHAGKLLAIGCFCIGTNQVNLAKATQAGIAVFNSPYSNTRSVAELVIAEIIMLLRRIPEKDRGCHEGVWLKTTKGGSYEVRGKKLGIVGYGHIGSQVSVLAEAMGMKVMYYDIEPKLPMGNATAVESLEELLEKSDVVTLHVPATPLTKNMINEHTIARMKKNAILLNLSRGNVVDIAALRNALQNKHLSGAAIDVFPAEPISAGDYFVSPLQGLGNVILTPHIGGSTYEAQENIGVDVALKLSNYLDKGATVGSHTIPELNLAPVHGTHRILHIHQNVPGVLSAINSIISASNANIVGQYLKTNEQIGYVVLDIENINSDVILNQLRQVEHTIKTRILY
ncbi:phosphoglycerate dehydrogenase [Sphingobacteriales bacterium UPWRP_1]|nr:D-3-phosphoglycerate dehydrogenase [Sphingobacteriales bacterium TSM_CSM]PSJ77033.1 phosphoglycerate dehydrogenase [Sphingobacteriales bacterium UPWRP_1]